VNGFGGRRLSNFGAQMGLGPAVSLLLVANVAVFLAEFLISGMTGRDPIGAWGAFIPYFAVNQLQFWRFVTYMFLHGSLLHLFFNMLGLWLFGSRIEQIWGTRTFAWYYFVAGIGGAFLYGLFSLAGISALVPMVGASAAIYGILLAFGLAFPNAIIFVFFIPMPARIAVIVFGVMALLGFGGANVAHMAHLGGMITGFLFLWAFTGGRPSQVPRRPRVGGARGGYRSLGGAGYDRTAYRTGSRPTATPTLRHLWQRWRTRLRMTVVDGQRRGGQGAARPGQGRDFGGEDPARIDQILEKISREGLRSLTEEEQEVLRRASRKH